MVLFFRGAWSIMTKRISPMNVGINASLLDEPRKDFQVKRLMTSLVCISVKLKTALKTTGMTELPA